MKKLFTLLCLCVLCIGSAWGANYTLVTDASGLKNGDVVVFGCATKAKASAGINSKYLDAVDATFEEGILSSETAVEITLVKVSEGEGWYLAIGDKYINTTAAKALTFADNASTVWTIEIDEEGLATVKAGDYGRFLYNAGSPRFLNYTSATSASMLLPQLYKKGTNKPTAVAPAIIPSAEADAYFEAITVTLASETEGASIYYTTNGDAPTTASTLYESPISVNETTTIKAIAVKEGVENSGVVSKTFTFGPTYNSLADLVAAEIASGTIVKVSFENATITEFYTNTQGKRYGVYLNTQKGDKDIEIYCNAAEHPAEWAANGKLSGTLVGAWQEYYGTWEICPDSWEGLTYTAPSKQNPTITATYKTTLGVEEKDEYTVTYSGDGELSITSSNTDVAEATIVGGKVLIETKSAGTTTITISATETEDYNAVNEEYTLKVVGPAALPFAYNGGKSGLSNGMTQTGLGSDYSSLPKLKFDDTGDELVIWFAEQAGYVSYDIKGNSFAGGTFQVMESADGEEYTVVSTHTGLGAVTTIGNALNSDSRYVKFVYTSKSTGNVALGNICINKPVSITAAGWATAYVPFNATVSDNVTAYYVKVEDGALVKTEADVIPAGTGVLLKSNDGNTATATFTAATAAADEVKDNMLVGALTETTFSEEDTKYFILANGTNGVGFYFQGADNTTGSTVTCAAGKAVLAVPTAKTGAKAFFLFDDEPLGIKEINNAHKQDALYNLNGVRVNGNYNGIVIINGKKVIK